MIFRSYYHIDFYFLFFWFVVTKEKTRKDGNEHITSLIMQWGRKLKKILRIAWRLIDAMLKPRTYKKRRWNMKKVTSFVYFWEFRTNYKNLMRIAYAAATIAKMICEITISACSKRAHGTYLFTGLIDRPREDFSSTRLSMRRFCHSQQMLVAFRWNRFFTVPREKVERQKTF